MLDGSGSVREHNVGSIGVVVEAGKFLDVGVRRVVWLKWCRSACDDTKRISRERLIELNQRER